MSNCHLLLLRPIPDRFSTRRQVMLPVPSHKSIRSCTVLQLSFHVFVTVLLAVTLIFRNKARSLSNLNFSAFFAASRSVPHIVTRLPSRLHHTESGTTYSNPSRHTAGSTCFRRSFWFPRKLPALSFSYPQSVGPLLLYVSAYASLTHAEQTLLSPRNVGAATFSKTKALWLSIYMNCLRATDIPPAAFLYASVHHIDDALRLSCTMAFCSCSSSCIFVGSSFLVTSLFSVSIFQLLSFLSGTLPSSNPSILLFIRPFFLLLFDSGVFLLTSLCPNRYLE